MHLQFVRPPVGFPDGSGSWDGSAADALNLWNEHLDTVRFVAAPPITTPAPGDGVSSAFFDNNVYGEDFGPNTLAVTLYFGSKSDSFSEADVIVNSVRRWESYRGPLQGTGADVLYDFHRVVLHEFGHALGLNHPDVANQTVEALMNSVISDLDHLAADDIAGVRSLYGNSSANGVTGAVVSVPVKARIAGGTFSATNLPPGLTIDAATGLIHGIATLSGIFHVAVNVVSPDAMQTIQFEITVTAPPAGSIGPIGTLLRSFGFYVGQLAADPSRDRMYATVPASNSVVVIDTASFDVIATIPVGANPFGLSVSADGSKLWVANRGSKAPAISVIDLGTLTPLAEISAPDGASEVVEGREGRLYASGSASFPKVMQIDSRTGKLQGYVAGTTSVYGYPIILKCSPDRTRLFLAERGGSSLYRFDVSGPVAVELQRTTTASNGRDLAVSGDGRLVLYPGGGGDRDAPPNSTKALLAVDLTQSPGSFSVGAYPGPVCFSPDDSVLYHSTAFQNAVELFDPVTYAKIDTIVVPLQLELADIAVDNTGASLFCALPNFYQAEGLRIYSTGRVNPAAKLPGKPKSLLNVSTRLLSQPGDGALIAGFIITGTESKKIAIRGIGPSLSVAAPLADPVVELRSASGELIVSNDNWNAQRAAVIASGLAPTDEHEAVAIAELAPGAYTVVLRGVGDTTGAALVEVYDLSSANDSRIADISTRGKVETGDNVMIAGFIIGPDQPTTVVARALGPSLAAGGVSEPLPNPTLALYDADGTIIAQNDDWQLEQPTEISATGISPSDPREAALIRTLPPGPYTAIVRGEDGTTGVGLVEVYNLDAN